MRAEDTVRGEDTRDWGGQDTRREERAIRLTLVPSPSALQILSLCFDSLLDSS